jgi:hypothetical protein
MKMYFKDFIIVRLRTIINLRLLYLISTIVITPAIVQARVFLVGSNPNLTILAFPQDILKFPTDNAFVSTSYENKPWWGDVDDPPNKPMNESASRPNNTYIATGENIDMGDGNTFKCKSVINSFANIGGFNYSLKDSLKCRFDLKQSSWIQTTKASGTSANSSFKYVGRNSFNELYLTSILAGYFKKTPVGLKLGIGRENATKPKLKFKVNNSGTKTSYTRLYWGWSYTTHTGELDFLNNELVHAAEIGEYSIGPLWEFDLQGGATFPKLCLGGRFRINVGDLDTYTWPANANNYILSDADKVRNITGRLYGNYIWSEGEKYRFATLVLTRLTRLDTTRVNIDNPRAKNGDVRKLTNFVLQINPNVSLYPWRTRQTYIDGAILLNYSFMHFANETPFGLTNGGQIQAYKRTETDTAEEYSWRDCSYFNQNFFEIALDLNPVFPIYGNKDQSIAVGVMLLMWTRFKWTNKYYGESVQNGSEVDFNVERIRKNYDHETWLNSFFNIIYRRGKWVYRLDVSQPLIYSLTPQSRVVDKKSKEVLWESKTENMWVSQSGIKIGFFMATGLDNLFNKPQINY